MAKEYIIILTKTKTKETVYLLGFSFIKHGHKVTEKKQNAIKLSYEQAEHLESLFKKSILYCDVKIEKVK